MGLGRIGANSIAIDKSVQKKACRIIMLYIQTAPHILACQWPIKR